MISQELVNDIIMLAIWICLLFSCYTDLRSQTI